MDEQNKKRRAAAIKYEPGDNNAPVLAAFGEGFTADRIVQKAEEARVPVLPDPDLTSVLANISVGDEIPPELYEVVAKLLLFVSEIDKNFGKRVKDAVRDARAG